MQKILNITAKELNLSTWEQKLLAFRLKCTLYDISKLILFAGFFIAMQKTEGFIFCFLIFFPIRQISGGLHFKHYSSCLIFSFIYLYLVIMMLAPIKLTFNIALAVLACCAAVVYLIGPVRPASRPALSAQEYEQQRRRAFSIVCYEIIIILLFFDSSLAGIGYWTVILHTLQLIIAFILRKGGEKK